MSDKPKPPAGLKAKGRRLWTDITGEYDLRVDELRILEDSCREADLIEWLVSELKGADSMVKGSMGQEVANPLIGEVRQHRTVLARLLSQLKLPDDSDGAAGMDASANARAMANARWNKRGA